MSYNTLLTKSAYKADVEISFTINEGETLPITHDRIKYIILDDSYEKYNNPVIWLGLSCSKKLFNAVVDNEKNATFKLNLSIHNAKTNIPLKRNSNIEGDFLYIVSTNNPNFYQDLAPDKEGTNTYIQLTVALYKIDSANVLRTPINGVMEIDVSTFLHTLVNQFPKYALTELKNNTELESLICSPKSTIVGTIKELFHDYPFFDTAARIFADFDKLYILDTSGEYTDAMDDDEKGFIFKVARVTTSSSYNEGWYIDGESYVVDVNPGMINILDNTAQDRICNNIVSINQLSREEPISSIDLELTTDPGSEAKTAFLATVAPETYKNRAESNTATLEIVKDDIDMSLITPNKTYAISIAEDMGPEYNKYDDKYTLVYKKVVLRNFNGDFSMSVNIGLRKVGNIVPVVTDPGTARSAGGRYTGTKKRKKTTTRPITNNNNNKENETTPDTTTGSPKRLFYQPKMDSSKYNKLPPVKRLKGVSLQRKFTKFSDYAEKREEL